MSWVNRRLEAVGLFLIDGIEEVSDDQRTKLKEESQASKRPTYSGCATPISKL